MLFESKAKFSNIVFSSVIIVMVSTTTFIAHTCIAEDLRVRAGTPDSSPEMNIPDSPTSNQRLGSDEICLPNIRTFASGKVPLRQLYVVAGAPAGGNGTISQPYNGLAQAAAAATPGTEIIISGILIHQGNANHFLQLNGTLDNPIWISGISGAQLRGGSNGPPLKLSQSSEVIVQNLELLNSPNHVLHFDFSYNLLFRYIHAHDAAEAVMKGSQSGNIYLEDSNLHGAGQGGDYLAGQVLDWVGVNGGHIKRNEFSDGPHQMMMLKGGTSDIFVGFNHIYNQHNSEECALGIGQWTGAQFFQPINSDQEVTRITVYANLIQQVSGPFVCFRGARDSAFIHNTLQGSAGPQVFRFLPGNVGSGCTGCGQSNNINNRVAGNIIDGGTVNSASMQCTASSIGAGNSVDHNIWLKPGPFNWWCPLPWDAADSTNNQNPMLNASGIPTNLALVENAGPSNVRRIKFNNNFIGDFAQHCVNYPADVGAFQVSD